MRAALIFAALAVVVAAAIVVFTMLSLSDISTPDGVEQADRAAPEPAATAVAPADGAVRPSGNCPPKPPPAGTTPPWFQEQMREQRLASIAPHCARTIVAAVQQGEPRVAQKISGLAALDEEVLGLLLDYQSCLEAGGQKGACEHPSLDAKTHDKCRSRSVLFGGLLPAAALRQPCPPDLPERCKAHPDGEVLCRVVCEALAGSGARDCTAAGGARSFCEVLLTHSADRCPPGEPGQDCRNLVVEIQALKQGEPGRNALWPSIGRMQGIRACGRQLQDAAKAICQKIELFDIPAELPEPSGP